MGTQALCKFLSKEENVERETEVEDTSYINSEKITVMCNFLNHPHLLFCSPFALLLCYWLSMSPLSAFLLLRGWVESPSKLVSVGSKRRNMVAETKSLYNDLPFTLLPFCCSFMLSWVIGGWHFQFTLVWSLCQKNIMFNHRTNFLKSVFDCDDILFDITEDKLVSNSHWHRLLGSLLKYTEGGPVTLTWGSKLR